MMHLPCFFRILCSLPLTSNNLPIATMPLMDNHLAYSGHRVLPNDNDRELYFSWTNVVEILLPYLLEEASLL
jgi:hypothetical protein